jgi:hypothetical protein
MPMRVTTTSMSIREKPASRRLESGNIAGGQAAKERPISSARELRNE